jgi:hypothetical protein
MQWIGDEVEVVPPEMQCAWWLPKLRSRCRITILRVYQGETLVSMIILVQVGMDSYQYDSTEWVG